MKETDMLTMEKREALLKLSTPLVVDAMDRLSLPERVLDPAIRPVVPFSRMVGTAVTVLLKAQPDPAKANLEIYAQAFELDGRCVARLWWWKCPRRTITRASSAKGRPQWACKVASSEH